MKFHSRDREFFFRSARPVVVALLGAAFIFNGCGQAKKPAAEAAPSPAAVQQAANDHMPTYPTAPPKAAAAAVTPSGEPDLSELNRSMLRWLIGHKRVPASFEEFSATAGVTIPPPPAGKKYAIGKDMHVVLVKQ